MAWRLDWGKLHAVTTLGGNTVNIVRSEREMAEASTQQWTMYLLIARILLYQYHTLIMDEMGTDGIMLWLLYMEEASYRESGCPPYTEIVTWVEESHCHEAWWCIITKKVMENLAQRNRSRRRNKQIFVSNRIWEWTISAVSLFLTDILTQEANLSHRARAKRRTKG